MTVTPVRRRRAALRLAVLVTAASLSLAACSSDAGPGPEPVEEASATPEPAPVSPLTGEEMAGGLPDNPVLVVKVENTVGGTPQYGLDQADLVVEELVEGGLTRLAAFFHSVLPTKVGHVRSMRTSDIGIAAPVAGQIVASGGASSTYRIVQDAGIRVFSEDHKAPGFSSDPLKSRPYNRLVDLTVVAQGARATAIPGPYFTFTDEGPVAETSATPEPAASSDAPAAEPTRATTAAVRFSRSTTTRWALQGDTWQRVNGHAEPGKDFAADTLVVMFCRVGDAGYRDPAGNPVPETVVEGSGRAVVIHGDTAVETTWSKDDLDSTISFTDEAGDPVTIDPGHVFVSLVPQTDGDVMLG